LKQWEEELEGKQRSLEEWDFELKEEKRQHRESRLFLARKMSELEARELRAAKEEERRLSGLSGTPASSGDRTPPSSSKKSRTPLRGSPPGGLKPSPEELVDHATQTEEMTAALGAEAAQQDLRGQVGRRQSCRRATSLCKRLCQFVVALHLAMKAFYLIGVVVVPELPSETVQSMAAWLPAPLETLLSLETGGDGALVTGSSAVVPTETSALPESTPDQPQAVLLKNTSDPERLLADMPESTQQHPPGDAEGQPSLSGWGWRSLSLPVIAALVAIPRFI